LNEPSTLYYVLKDHLGSASVVTDTSGTIVGEDRFYPFGETRFMTGTMQTDKLFTGQREMAGLGIYNYGARFYSPKLGRFLSADTIVPGYANPQNLNRFSYVNNNPLRYADPSGHMMIEESGGTHGCSNPKYCQNGKPKPPQQKKGSNTNTSHTRTKDDVYAPISTGNQPNIYVPVSGDHGPNIYVPVSGGSPLNIYIPVSGGSPLNIYILGVGNNQPNIYVPVDPNDIEQVLSENPKDILMPGGNPVGTQQGRNERIRTVGDEEELQQIFDALTTDGMSITSNTYEGTLYRLPDGGTVGKRDSVKHGPTIDINIPGIPIDKLHLPT
jgi:RHS repeat-associated protein